MRFPVREDKIIFNSKFLFEEKYSRNNGKKIKALIVLITSYF